MRPRGWGPMTSEAVRDLMLYGMLMVSAAGFYAMF